MTRVDPDWEEATRNEAVRAATEKLRGAPKGSAPLELDVLVQVARPLSDMARVEITESLKDLSKTERRAVLWPRFEVVAALADDFAVTCELLASGGGEASAPLQDTPQDDEDDVRLLVVTAGNSTRLEFTLKPSAGWVSLFRPDDRHGVQGGFRLPAELVNVPHGRVVELNNSAGNLVVRRSAQRPEYAVTINGKAVVAGNASGIRVGPAGTIVFTRTADGESAELRYSLLDWKPAALGTTASTVERSDRHPCVISAGGTDQRVEILPPEAGSRADSRPFLVTGAATAVERVDAQVLYTTAVAAGGDEPEWHVKIYRCATPQLADLLRGLLSEQATRIAQVNGAVGGSSRTPPWAIAPVHLVRQSSHVRAPLATDMNVDAGVPASSGDNRLSEWFGLTGRPQPDCFVVVASPLLHLVQWPAGRYRDDAPGVSRLESLEKLGAGLDKAHDAGIAHGDVKPDNVCLAVLDGQPAGFVFVDGDSVLPVICPADFVRPTKTFTSSEFRSKLVAGGPVNLRTHDRFGFALVVLAAVVGPEVLDNWLGQSPGTGRIIDSHDRVLAALNEIRWPRRWKKLRIELAEPFRSDALVDWSARQWVRNLIEIRDTPLACAHDSCPPDRCEEAEPPPKPGVYAHHIREIRRRTAEVMHNPADWQARVIEHVRAEQKTLARKEFLKVLVLAGSLTGAIALLIALSVVLAAVQGGQ
jgi:hypothetical protein